MASDKVYTHGERLIAAPFDTVLKKKPRSNQRLRTVVNDILDHQQQNMLISQKRALKRWNGTQCTLCKEQKTEARYCHSWKSKCSCSEEGKSSFEHDPEKRGEGKGHRSRSLVHRDNAAERQYARKTGRSPSSKEDRPPCFNCKIGNYSHDRRCDYCYLPHCKYFKKDKCKKGKDCSFIH